MVHNMLMSLQNMDEINLWENRPFSGVMVEAKRGKPDIKKPIKKKVKRNRTAFTTKQLRALELLFNQNKYIAPERRREISKALNLGDKNVKIWFQNRRMKEKRESSESSRVESDSSSETHACCEKSPPSTLSTGSYNLHNESTTNGSITLESCQYEVPHFYANIVNDQQVQNVHASDYNALHPNDMQFYNESNMYPTQYYPYNGNYTNDYNYYQYQQENFMQNWTSHNFAPCYFNNGEV